MATLATYDGSVDNTNNISTTAWWAQGFKIPAGSTISGIAVKGSRGSGATGTFRVRIYEGGTDTNCDGGTLVKDETFDISILPVYTASPVLSTVTFTSATAELTGGSTQYYLTISCPTGSPTNDVLRWSYDSTSSSYADGTTSVSTDGGATWTNYSTLDLNFSIFGGQYLLKNLVSYWKLNETSGTRNDIHGVNHLSDGNTVLYGTGKLGNAADFESSASEYLYIADNASLSLTGNLTISAWVKFETYGTGQVGLVSKWQTSSALRSYLLFTQDNRLQFTCSNTGSYITQKYVDWIPTTGVWYHVVAVYTASAGSVSFYVDGSQLGTTQTGLPTSIHDNASDFTVGRSDGTSYFDGMMDELALWSRALTSTEVTRLYNSGSGLAYEDLGTAPSSTTYNEARRMFMMMM